MIQENATHGAASAASAVRRGRDQDEALAEEELRWYYQSSDAALGERSTWEAMVTAAQIGGGLGCGRRLELICGEPTHPGPTEWQVWAANRQTRIRRRLCQLTRRHQAVLEATFKIRRADKQLRGLFGDRAEPVVTYLRKLGVVKLRRDGDAEDRIRIRDQALGLLGAAVGAFMATREQAASEAQYRQKRQPAPTIATKLEAEDWRKAATRGIGALLPAMVHTKAVRELVAA